ncbi:MAG: deoxyribodipyrimidine photo-lyase [Anaerolineales bacterium]|nr:deoxyribodipyrimidine photo-lyase [Anaerolineales bacterium]
MPSALWWLRRDLRLHDNPALHAALQHGSVIPVFILDPAALGSRYHARAENRRAFLFGGLRALDAELQARGSRLIVREGRPIDVLRELLAETGATAIFAEEDFSPYARRRDLAVQRMLPLTLTGSVTVHHPESVQKQGGGPYTVFTPFSKAWKARPLPTARDLLPAPVNLSSPISNLSSSALPDLPLPPHFPPTEAEAQRRLADFVSKRIFSYSDDRNRLDLEGTSALSPYFRFGLLSARAAVVAALEAGRNARDQTARKGAETWLNELIWREFYLNILYHFPEVLTQAFNPSLRNIPWREAPDELAAWQQGLTGYPVVDACMRQLNTLGWMHNRGRMIVASFLVKDLLIDWRLGEHYFMEKLVDGDPAANNGGWQWTAGVGTDAAPYFRIFNPVLQSQKFDPHGAFLRRWLPELANVPDKFLHAPWEMTPLEQRACGVVLGEHYPRPIVDRSAVKARTLAAYKQSQLK